MTEDDVVLVPLDPLMTDVLRAIIAWLDERQDPRLECHADGRVTIHEAGTVLREYAGLLTDVVDRASWN